MSDHPEAVALAERARRKLAAGDLVAAVRDSNVAVTLSPGDRMLYRVRRRMIRAFKDACRSPQGLAKVVRADPNLVWFYNERFEADCCWGRFDKVLAGLERELKLEPRNARALALKGEVLRMPAFSRFEEGVDCLAGAAALEPRSPWIRAFLGRARLYTGRPRDGLADLRKAAALDPGCGWIRAWLGEGLYNAGRYREALRELDRAVLRDEECAVARSFRGAAKERLGRFAAAVADLDAALSLHKRYAEVYVWPSRSTRDWEELLRIDLYGLSLERGFVFYERARAKRGLGDWAGAASDMAQAMKLDAKYHWLEGEASKKELERIVAGLAAAGKKDFWPAAWRGELLLRAGRPKEAVAALERAAALDPRCAWVFAWRARARLSLGEPRRALSDAERALRLDKGCLDAQAAQAQAWQALGRPASARRCLDRLLKRDPKLAWAFCWRSELRLKSGDTRGALADAERAVRLHPGFADAYFWRAEARRSLGVIKEALADLDRSLELKPGNPLALVSRGVALASLGKSRESLASFRLAKRADPALPL